MPANVETMFSVRETPWHGLGVVIQEAPNSEEALEVAGLNWEVEKSPIIVNNQVVKGYVANVRNDSGSVLGIVTDKYKIVQNKEAFSFVDALVDAGEVRYETAGSLKGGKQVWMLAKMPERYKVLDDEMENFMVFTNSHDGRGAVVVAITPVRVVCQNTLNLALSQAKRQWSVKHMGLNMEEKLAEAKHTLQLAGQYTQELQIVSEQLVDIKVTTADWKDIVTQLIPIGDKVADRQKRNLERRRTVMYNKIFESDVENYFGTGWAAINAVTDFVAHTRPERDTATYKENLFASIVGGHPIVDKAFTLLVA